MINVAIVGAGFMGNMHANCYKFVDGANLAAIVDITDENRTKFAEKFGCKGYKSLDELFNSEKIDAVDVTIPTINHAEVVVEIAKAGKHVFCEKPIALSLKEADAMIDATKKAKVKFMVGHVLRFWPEYMKMKELVDAGEIGKIKLIQAERLGGIPTWAWQGWLMKPKMSGGAVVDLHIHDMDTIAWFCGMPKEISAGGFINKAKALDEVMTMGLGHKGGVDSCAWASLAMPESFGFFMNLRILGEKGTIQFDSRLPKALAVFKYGGAEPEYPEVPKVETGVKVEGGNVSDLGGYFNEIKYFIDCIKENRMPKTVTPQDARNALQLVLASRMSVETGRKIAIK